MKRSMTIVGVLLAAIVLVGGAFWGGMSVGKAQAQSDSAQAQADFYARRGIDPNAAGGTGANGAIGGAGGFFGGGPGGTGAGRGGAGNRGAAGTITKVEGNTITMTDAQGKTVTVNIAGDTPITKTVAGTAADLKPGMTIVVVGTRSGDNVAATQIQLSDRPLGNGGFFGGGGRGARSTPTPNQ
ncbi:MAG: hypothetical protein ACJ78Q_09360 [Chloroflexia bacterium]